jgi:exonuclease SbcD
VRSPEGFDAVFKFLHAADIHLDSPLHKLDRYEGAPVEEIRLATRRAFENMVRLAIAERVAFVLIAGDLFDGDWKDYNTGLYLVSQLSRLQAAGIPVFIVAGNHDAASRITRTLRLPANVSLFPSGEPATCHLQERKVAIHGQSFGTPTVKDDLSAAYPPLLPGCFNIGLLHTCATGREGHEPYAPCTLDGLRARGYDYWALGHVHQHEVLAMDPPIVFSGNIQGRHARETGPKGCVLVSVDDQGRADLEFRHLDVVRWVRMTVDVTGARDGYEVVDRFGRKLEQTVAHNEGMTLAARIRIDGQTSAQSELLADPERWINEMRSAALATGAGSVWVEKIVFTTALPSSLGSTGRSEGALAELANLFDELAADPDTRRELAAELADLEKKLPRELTVEPEGLSFDDADWLADLLQQVRPLLLHRLLHREGPE